MRTKNSLSPEESLVKTCREIAKETGARLTITESVEEGVEGVDYLLYRCVGFHGRSRKRCGMSASSCSSLTRSTWTWSGRPAMQGQPGAPAAYQAFHNRETKSTRGYLPEDGPGEPGSERRGVEVQMSIVFAQAKNRMHTIKAIMVATLGD